MRIFVLGATGVTGGQVVVQALEQGMEVCVLVRDPGKLSLKHPRLTVLGGSPLSHADIERSLLGSNAVIHCLGIGGKGDGRPTTLISDSVKIVLDVMKKQRVERIVCMSNVGAGGSGTWFANSVIVPLFLRWLLPIVEDKDRMESALRESSAEYVSVRLPMIVEGPIKPVRLSDHGRGIGLTITASSAARFLLETATGTKFLRSMPSISN